MAYGSGGKYEYGATRYVRTVVRAWRIAGIGGHRELLRVVEDPGQHQWQLVHKTDSDPSIENHDSEGAAVDAAKTVIANSGKTWVETSARAHERL